ncbi:MAG: prephenate dehydrogenase [Clostridiales bacterium]|jgi:prephenate dehydrogenase|nr:prephenate dehydrogenase [Clostridiales bacterium]
MECRVRKVSIIGLGLIGGSIAKALRRSYGSVPEIHAVDQNEDYLAQAKKEGVIDSYALRAGKDLSGSEIIFIATPVHTAAEHMKLAAKYAGDGCIITDTGSTKNSIYKHALENKINYIGGHPMTGSERSGYRASKEFLFENAYYILTPAPYAGQHSADIMRGIVKDIGALPLIMDAREHDSVMAAISHLPHIIAASLVNTVEESDDENKTMHALAAGGFRDITRVASSNPEMWSAICAENKEQILKSIKAFQNSLAKFYDKLNNSADSTQSFFQNAKNYRDSFSVKPAGSYINEYRIFVDVYDKPGIIATASTLLSVNNINIKNIGIVNSREYQSGVMQIVFETLESMEKSAELLRGMNFTVYSE